MHQGKQKNSADDPVRMSALLPLTLWSENLLTERRERSKERPKRASVGWKTGFEPATSGTTIQRSNQLSYNHHY